MDAVEMEYLNTVNVLKALLEVTTVLFIVIGTTICFIYLWAQRRYSDYWRSRGIECPKPSFPFGNNSKAFTNKLSIGQCQAEIYHEHKDKKLIGTFLVFKPVLIVADYKIASQILGVDFPYFISHGPEINEKLDPLGVHLFNASGTKWKELRDKLTPAFTSGKLKQMFGTMDRVGSELQAVFAALADAKQEVEVQDIVARYTTDVIGNCAFGVECNSLKDENASFRRCGQRIFQHKGFEALKLAMGFFFPEVCTFLGIVAQKKEVQEFIFNTINDTIKFREDNNIKRNDFLDILLQIKNRTLTDDQGNLVDTGQGTTLTENEFMSQVYLFFLAGFETSSSTTSFALHELACNPRVQAEARRQVRRVLRKHHGQYTYDALSEMEYVSNIINETLRKYPPLPFLLRKCTTDYEVHDSKVKIEKETLVFISILGLQMDPQHFPDPTKFDPDRFLQQNRHPHLKKIFMPFGYGPRHCIGQRFGILETKVALVKLLEKYEFSIGRRATVPMKLKPGFHIAAPLAGNWLAVKHAAY